MKILQVIPTVNRAGGGPIAWLEAVTAELQSMGHTSDVASMDDPNAKWVAEAPFKVYALGPPSAGEYAYAPTAVKSLQHIAQDYDVVVSHGIWLYSSIAVHRAMTKINKPYFVCVHGMLDPWFKRTFPLKHTKKWFYWQLFERFTFQDAAGILYTCDEERILARQSFKPYRCREMVSRLGTRVHAGDPSDMRRQLIEKYPQLDGKRNFLFLSRLHDKKGCDILIHAFAAVADSDPSLHLIMAGPDSMGWLERLTALAEQLGISKRITWTGMLSGDLKWGAFYASEVFVLPSHQETFPISMIEASACGVPVLTSRGVNIWRDIVDAGAGYAAADTVEGATELLQKWLALSPDDREEMRQRAVKCYEEKFELGSATRQLLTAIQQ